MQEYKIRWEIDIEADTPEEAAKKALLIQRDRESLATHFVVIPMVGEHIPVDLDFSLILPSPY
jgi:hypothetical protein